MTQEKKYQALHDNKIFIGGAADVQAMVENEQIDVIVDLRGEAKECAYPEAKAEWVQIPLGDEATEPQDVLFQRAIQEVIDAYQSGKKVAFHCNGGRGRTGAVAVGTLLNLGLADSLADAEDKVKAIRPEINIKPKQRESLAKMYPNG
ncbi:protein-tyrosine phosphatase family protein [Brevibacillus dissolubilis]|uniref:protein-tyrosine phosphatase family protein n=1 Tax=Brevibacillus dissolubilis TaxID=1844116 RepID=UPI0011166067|nr:dual specificity protein phosphatase family protein [Brevibacillus dissolubilis]